MAVTVEIAAENVPENLRDLAEKWSAAVCASLDLLQQETTSTDDASMIIDIGLHSAAAVLAPGELSVVEFIHMVNRFSQALADVGTAYTQNKTDHEATRQ